MNTQSQNRVNPLNLSRFKNPGPSQEVPVEQLRELADKHGFVPNVTEAADQKKKPRRRRTGRDAQLNIKLRPDCKARFEALADKNKWGLGEALEKLLDHFQQ